MVRQGSWRATARVSGVAPWIIACAAVVCLAVLGGPVALAGEPVEPADGPEDEATEEVKPPDQPKEQPKKMIKLGKLEGGNLLTVITTVAKGLEVNLLYPEDLVNVKVSYLCSRDLPADEALEILRAILDDENYMLVESPYFLKIVKKEEMGPQVTEPPDQPIVVLPGDSELGNTEKPVTAIIVLDYIDANEVVGVLGPLRDKRSLLNVLPRINAIILKDAESRVNYLMKIVEKLDVPGTAGIVEVRQIKFADAGQMAETVKAVLGGKGPALLGGDDMGEGTVPMVPGGPLTAVSEGVKIIEDARLNSLIIVGSEREIKEVLKLIDRLDVPQDVGPPIHIYECKNQEAGKLAQMLTDFASWRPPTEGAQPGQPARTGGKEAEVFLIADESTNKIIVAASPLEWEIYKGVLDELDKPQPQVLVEVWIVEVSSNDQFNLGVDWQTRGPQFDARVGPSVQEVGLASSTGTGLGDVFGDQGYKRGFNVLVRSFSNTRVTIGGKTYLVPDIDAYLKALSETTKTKVLGSPKLLTLNKEEASVNVTNEISISQSQITGAGDTRDVVENFERQKVGITLKFTPQINADGFVIMTVDLKVSSIVGADITEAGTRPVIAERTTLNKVRVENGQTIVISGLRRHDTAKTVVRVPVLGRIPLVGLLFRSTSTIDQQTNLMIFITPHIVTDTPQMVSITETMQGQDIERYRDRFTIEPKEWRKLQLQRQREKDSNRGDVW